MMTSLPPSQSGRSDPRTQRRTCAKATKGGLRNYILLAAVALLASLTSAREHSKTVAFERQAFVNKALSEVHLTQDSEATEDSAATEGQASAVVEELSPYENAIKNFHYFNRGFKGDELANNFSACGNRSAYWYFWERETYTIKLNYGTFEENAFNSTLFLQNTTDVLYICTDTFENMFYYFLYKQSQFPTANDFGLAFLQNLLSNVIRLQTISNEMIALQDAEDQTNRQAKEYYYIGVILNMLTIFDPVAQDLNRVAVTSDNFPLLRSTHFPWRQDAETDEPTTEEPAEPTDTGEVEPTDTASQVPSFTWSQYTAEDVVTFSRALIDGTDLVPDQTYLDKCEALVSNDFVQKGHDIVLLSQELDYFSALYALYDMIWSVHPLLVDCAQSLDTAPETLKARFEDAEDIKVLITNVVHNASLMVDTARDIWAFFAEGQISYDEDGVYEAGYGAGRIIYYLIADNELAKLVDPAEGMDLPNYQPSTPEDETEEPSEEDGTEEATTTVETTE